MEHAEHFIPGLVRMVEERLGRVGRLLTIVLIISVVLGLTTFFFGLFWKGAIAPLVQVFGPLVAGDPTLPPVSSILSIALSFAVPIAGLYVLWALVRRRLAKLGDQVEDLQSRLHAAAVLVRRTSEQIQGLDDDRQRINKLEQALNAGYTTQASQTSIIGEVIDLLKDMMDRQGDFQRRIFEVESRLEPEKPPLQSLTDFLAGRGILGGPPSPTFREYLERNKDTP